LLANLRKAVNKSVNGQSIGEFRKDFAAAVAKSGWSGWTGEGTKAGEAWRTRVIYQTNVATSYAAGRWQQLNDPDLKAARPFWKYIHADGVIYPRPLHKAWGDAGLTLPSDHPFWRTHFPPNDWGCGCRVKAVRLPRGNDATSPPEGWDTIDEKTGAPLGIDKGWGYAPGANVNASVQSLIDNKLLNVDAPIGAAMWQTLKPLVALERQQTWWATLDSWNSTPQAGRVAALGALDPSTLN
jgi:Phage Mu protein F like protein